MHHLTVPLNRRDEQLWRKVYREDAWRAQKGKCCYCGEAIQLKAVTAEHIKPRKERGHTNKSNIKAACRDCNNAKGSMTDKKFRKLLSCPTGEGLNIQLASFRYKLWKRVEKFEKRLLNFVGLS